MTAIEKVVTETFERVSEIEQKLSQLDREQAIEEAELELKFDLTKAPLLKQRNECLEAIPDFWSTALQNHALFAMAIDEQDLDLLSHLKSIEVERPKTNFRHFKIIFHFKPNAYLEDEKLIKEFTSDDGEMTFINHPIKWKEGQCLVSASGQEAAGGKRKRDNASFFEFFADESEGAVEMAAILLSDFLPNVMSYFQGDAGDDLISEDGEEDEDTEESEEALEADKDTPAGK